MKRRNVKSSRPTGGDCYRVALDIAIGLIKITDKAQFLPSSLRVCHGFPTGQGPIAGTVHGHAWIEVQEYATGNWLVVDKSNRKDILMPREAYYAIGKIDPATVDKYTSEQAARMALAYKHCGPWDEEEG